MVRVSTIGKRWSGVLLATLCSLPLAARPAQPLEAAKWMSTAGKASLSTSGGYQSHGANAWLDVVRDGKMLTIRRQLRDARGHDLMFDQVGEIVGARQTQAGVELQVKLDGKPAQQAMNQALRAYASAGGIETGVQAKPWHGRVTRAALGLASRVIGALNRPRVQQRDGTATVLLTNDGFVFVDDVARWKPNATARQGIPDLFADPGTGRPGGGTITNQPWQTLNVARPQPGRPSGDEAQSIAERTGLPLAQVSAGQIAWAGSNYCHVVLTKVAPETPGASRGTVEGIIVDLGPTIGGVAPSGRDQEQKFAQAFQQSGQRYVSVSGGGTGRVTRSVEQLNGRGAGRSPFIRFVAEGVDLDDGKIDLGYVPGAYAGFNAQLFFRGGKPSMIRSDWDL